MAASTASKFWSRMWRFLFLLFVCLLAFLPVASCERTIKLVHLSNLDELYTIGKLRISTFRRPKASVSYFGGCYAETMFGSTDRLHLETEVYGIRYVRKGTATIAPARTCYVNPEVTISERKTMQFLGDHLKLYRHGDRSPILGYPNGNYTEDTWPQGFGQLTQRGVAQHYELGQWLRKRYVTDLKLFDGTYRPKQFYVRSTTRERTIMSALSNLQGFFPAESWGGEPLSGMPSWPPVPVFTVPVEQDYMLSINKIPDCDTARDFFEYAENSPPKQQYIKDNQTFFDKMKEKAGFDDDVIFSNFSRLADTLIREKRDGRYLPEWVDIQTYNRLKTTLDFAFEAEFFNMTTDGKRINSGVLIADMVANMKAHLERTNNDSRIFIYSGHDTDVAPFLSTFGVFNKMVPPTASCIMVELYREDDGSHTVQLLFRNDTSRPPYLLKFLDCNEKCPVQNFFHIASPFVVSDIDELCRRKPPSFPLHVQWNIGWILAASSLVLAALLPLFAFVVLTLGVGGRRRLQNSKQRLEPINFHLLGGPNSESEDESVFDT